LLKIVKRAKGLKTLFNTMLTSLPSMANISSLMFLLFFVYAIIGITLFGATRYNEFYTEDANFRNFPVALLLLFRMSTGENWNEVMGDCQVEPPYCTNWGERADCGMKLVSPVYYSSFFMFGVYLMLNLFIAVILDNFSNCYNKESNTVTQDHLEQYRALWRKYDIGGTGFIRFKDMRPLIEKLERRNNPLVTSLTSNRVLYGHIHSDMKTLAIRELKGSSEDEVEERGRVNFNRLCESLCVLQMEVEMEGSYLTQDERAMMEDKQRTLRRDVAASVIGSAIRGFLARRRYQNRLKAIAEAEAMRADDEKTPRRSSAGFRGNALRGLASWKTRNDRSTPRTGSPRTARSDRSSPRTPKTPYPPYLPAPSGPLAGLQRPGRPQDSPEWGGLMLQQQPDVKRGI